MTEARRVSPVYSLLPREIEGFDSLAELARDMRWSWNHASDGVWRRLDPELWEITHNPWVVLQTVSRQQIERVLADPVFRASIDDLVQARRAAAEAPAWFQQNHAQESLKWPALRFGDVKVETRGEQHVFAVQIWLDDLDPKAVRIELYAEGPRGSAAVCQEMARVGQLPGGSGGALYSAAVSAARPAADYTPRAIPRFEGVAIPLEEARVLWQR